MTSVVFLFSPPSRPAQDLRRALEIAVGARDEWNLVSHPFARLDRGRGVVVASRADALYRSAHRARTCVLSHLQVDAERHGMGGRGALGRLLRYKAFFRTIERMNDIQPALTEFDDWASTPPSDERDPRVLPLHVFAPKEDLQELDDPAARALFWRTNRSRNGGYVDSESRPWPVAHPGAMHGHDALTVREFQLRPGYHWDSQGVKRESTLRGLTKSHVIPYMGHCNVHPDGAINPKKREIPPEGEISQS